MTESHAERWHLRRGETIVALIGLAGVIVTALLSNWDKVFRNHETVKATYTGYRPTGNFETELRYYFDVSGARQTLDSMQKQFDQNAKAYLIKENPADAADIEKVFETTSREAIRLDDVIKALLPVYQKHFTLAEIQELNKFYSTDVMQAMVKKAPLLAQDAAPIQVQLMNDYTRRVLERLTEP